MQDIHLASRTTPPKNTFFRWSVITSTAAGIVVAGINIIFRFGSDSVGAIITGLTAGSNTVSGSNYIGRVIDSYRHAIKERDWRIGSEAVVTSVGIATGIVTATSLAIAGLTDNSLGPLSIPVSFISHIGAFAGLFNRFYSLERPMKQQVIMSGLIVLLTGSSVILWFTDNHATFLASTEAMGIYPSSPGFIDAAFLFIAGSTSAFISFYQYIIKELLFDYAIKPCAKYAMTEIRLMRSTGVRENLLDSSQNYWHIKDPRHLKATLVGLTPGIILIPIAIGLDASGHAVIFSDSVSMVLTSTLFFATTVSWSVRLLHKATKPVSQTVTLDGQDQGFMVSTAGVSDFKESRQNGHGYVPIQRESKRMTITAADSFIYIADELQTNESLFGPIAEPSIAPTVLIPQEKKHSDSKNTCIWCCYWFKAPTIGVTAAAERPPVPGRVEVVEESITSPTPPAAPEIT